MTGTKPSNHAITASRGCRRCAGIVGPIDSMKPQSLLVAFLLLCGCSSPPKDVSEAWRQFRQVRQGMTRQEVHAVLKDVHPTLSESGSPDSRLEEWIVGRPFAHPGYSAGLSLAYGSDDRVMELRRWRHRARPLRMALLTAEDGKAQPCALTAAGRRGCNRRASWPPSLSR